MRTLITIMAVAVVLFPLTASGTIWYVPDDFGTIQVGINSIPDGDTLIVREGTYYENLNFNGHNIVLASLFLTTGDTAFISNTIIDGGQSRGVITFENGEDSTAWLVGFTIQNGYAAEDEHGAGICCQSSSPTITYNVIRENSAELNGGGVFFTNSSSLITDNTIRGNSAGNEGGGIGCYDNSHPTIIDNTIAGNSAGEWGGGIYCTSNSSPTIRDNIISGNSARGGGGIHCYWYADPIIINNTISGNSALPFPGGGISLGSNCSPIISGNTISGNLATLAGGGGIFSSGNRNPTISNNTIEGNRTERSGGGILCIETNPTISHNVIKGNSAGYQGGGLCCYSHSTAAIVNNTISENSADSSGGAVYCEESYPVISGNVIQMNSAHYGGGINCSASAPVIINNTIVENSAEVAGGICCAYVSNPTITNTICWEDSADYAPEIWADTSSSPVISYCNIQDTLWPGSGNIDEDPIFVGPYNEDFRLRWRSPCIDAGHPDPIYNDPDGTRNDMGSCYFKQDVAGIVEVYPHDQPIVIPPEGGDITYDGWVFNFFGHAGRVDIWTYAFVPEMGRYGPIDLYESVRIPVDSLGMNEITEHVPGIAPVGDYVFVAYVGNYPSTIIDSSCFYFTKAGAIAGGIADWESLKGWFEGEFLSTESGLPTHYTLSQNYPNPFNTTTTINYQLPVDGHVKLEAYNTLGQKVATLVDEKQKAGYRLVNWDASEVSSGLCFYKLTAGDYTETKRMMLLK